MKGTLGYFVAGLIFLFIVGFLLLLPAALRIFTTVEIYRTPIEFWGKVVDENGQPIADVSIHYEAIDKSFGPATGYAGEDSDENGLFSLNGAQGVGLYVRVYKDGYYQLGEKSMRGFHSGSADMPTKDHPAIFVLRKRGPTEPLIMIRKDVKIAKDGTPTSMDLTNGHTFEGSSVDIRVQSWVNDASSPVNSGKPFDWRCVITVPGGGLQVRDGEFDFQAPESGYRESDEIVMPASSERWRSRADRSYFLKLADGRYARIKFSMMAGRDNFFNISSYLNPVQNHRNLESASGTPAQ